MLTLGRAAVAGAAAAMGMVMGVTLAVEVVMGVGVLMVVGMGMGMLVGMDHTVVGVLVGMGMLVVMGMTADMIMMNVHMKHSFSGLLYYICNKAPCQIDLVLPHHRFDQTDDIALENVRQLIENGETIIPVTNLTKGFTAEMKLELTNRQRSMILAGGLINMIAQQNQ
jgi:hypothetical protein